MPWQIVTFGDIQTLPVPRQFLAFAEAYLDAAHRQCTFVGETPEGSTYTQGAVALSLAYHGIELFLKGAILEREGATTQLSGRSGHDLKALYKSYRALYPDKNYEMTLPFGIGMPDLSSIDETAAPESHALIEWMRSQIKERDRFPPPPDQVHRYPTDGKGTPWEGLFGFAPASFLDEVSKVQAEIQRLRPLLFPG